MTARILVAEDEQVIRMNLCEFLEEAGYDVEGVEDGQVALERIREADYEVLITDIRMPRLDGITLLKHVVHERPETRVVITTAYASVDTAVEALRHGAFDYILKPITLEDLLQKVKNVLEAQALRDELRRLRRTVHRRLGFEGIIGESEPMRRVFDLVERVAPTRSTVVVTGESGTGKELVARAIAARSELADREFLPVNMGAIPADLVESQLFGHEKGAFTGAERRREGLLRAVRGGTVFLDEIGELPLAAQAKLLRAVEAGEILPVGADRPVHADFRLITATNQDLASLVEDGRFRKDLFFRLSVFQIELPPLRKRPEDIPALVAHFAARHAASVARQPPQVTNDAMRLLLSHSWPGNVRELSNVIERAVILCDTDSISPSQLPLNLDADGTIPYELKPATEEFQRRHIEWVLGIAGGNRDRAAELLDVDVATLYRRLSRYRDVPDGGG